MYTKCNTMVAPFTHAVPPLLEWRTAEEVFVDYVLKQ